MIHSNRVHIIVMINCSQNVILHLLFRLLYFFLTMQWVILIFSQFLVLITLKIYEIYIFTYIKYILFLYININITVFNNVIT